MRPGASIVLLAGWLAWAPARAEPPAGTGAEVVVIAEGLDAGALGEDLALRVPGARVVDRREVGCDAGPCPGPGAASLDVLKDMLCESDCVIAWIEAGADGALHVAVRDRDGRHFRRVWSAAIAEPERAAATSLSHLLAAIDEGTAELSADAGAAGGAESGAEVRGAAPASETPSTGETASEPIASPGPRRAATPASPRIEVGPTVGLTAVAGVGPPSELAGWVGSGALVGVDLRTRRGLYAGLELRGLAAGDSGLRLARLRVAVALGHSLRRGLFELRTRAAVTVEPWWFAARPGGVTEFGAPLLGGAVSLTPGLSAEIAPRVRVHVGLRLEAALSVEPRQGGVAQLVDTHATPLQRLGGVELGAFAALGVSWGR